MKISFDMHLPFKIQIKDGVKSIHVYNNAEFMLTFHSYKRSTIIDQEYLLDEIDCTIITVDFMPHEAMTIGHETNEILRLTVINSIEFLNRFIDAIRIPHGLSNTHNITIGDLPTLLTLTINNDETYAYLTRPHDIISPYKQLSIEEFSSVGSYLQLWDTHPDVFLFEKFFASARSHLRKEQMIEAIVDLQTSFEIFIRSTHKLLLLHNGAGQEEINKASSISFRNVVEDHIGRMLRANLKFNEPSGPIHEWFVHLYKVRNEIVHSGRVYISGDEGYAAYDAYVNVRNHIADLLDNSGLMNENKKVDLNIFPKNENGVVDPKPILEKLKQQGMIPNDLKFYGLNQEEK